MTTAVLKPSATNPNAALNPAPPKLRFSVILEKGRKGEMFKEEENQVHA